MDPARIAQIVCDDIECQASLADVRYGWAVLYTLNGWPVVPIGPEAKECHIKGWPKFRLTPDQLAKWFTGPGNVAALLGDASRLWDVDVDSPEALKVGPHFLPLTPTVFGRPSKPRSHWLYSGESPLTGFKLEDPFIKDRKQATLVELRANSKNGSPQLTIIPPGVHRNGEVIRWDNQHGEPINWETGYLKLEPARVSAAELVAAVRHTAICSLVGRYWKQEISPHGHDLILALAGALLRAKLSPEAVKTIIREAARVAGYERFQAAGIDDTARALFEGRPVAGWPRLVELLPEKVVGEMAKWLGYQREEAAVRAASQQWPDPLPLGGELPPVALLEPDMLPESLREWVWDVAERMQIPLAFPAASMVVSLAGCVNRRVRVQPKEIDSSWIVTPNLWGDIIGPPGVMKSPIIEAIVCPIERIEAEWRKEYETELKKWKDEVEKHELKVAVWKESFKRAAKRFPPGEPEEKPELEAEEPTQPRLLLNDATFEAVHELLAKNPWGLLHLRDELTGWLATLDRQGREGGRAFFLES